MLPEFAWHPVRVDHVRNRLPRHIRRADEALGRLLHRHVPPDPARVLVIAHVGPRRVNLRPPINAHDGADLSGVVNHGILARTEARLKSTSKADVRKLAVFVCQERHALTLLPREAFGEDHSPPVALPHAIASHNDNLDVRGPDRLQAHGQEEVAEVVDRHHFFLAGLAHEIAVRHGHHLLLEVVAEDGSCSIVEASIEEYHVHLRHQLHQLRRHGPHGREVVEARGQGRGPAQAPGHGEGVLGGLARALLIWPVHDDMRAQL
mmetsp:Transcript_79612/g.234131  ORF Transcript_79612/g.234131 Transcript_79612/m.234131 type:complete len:263 (+) Transcript_79612:375-1163(+)